MTTTNRPLAAPARTSIAKTRVRKLARLIGGLFIAAGSLHAATTTRAVKLHPAAQSAGSAEAHGKIQPGTAKSHGDAAKAAPKRGGASAKSTAPAAKGTKDKKADVVPVKPGAKARRKKREPEMVDDPILMNRAEARRKGLREHLVTHAAQPEHAAVVAPAAVPEKRTLTVDDFVRAANGAGSDVVAQPVVEAPPVTEAVAKADEPQHVAARKSSAKVVLAQKPVVEKNPVADAKASGQMATQKPAPIVRSQAEDVAEAPPSPYVVKPGRDLAMGVPFEAAPQHYDAANGPHSSAPPMVHGFGAEMAPLTANSTKSAGKPSAKNAPVETPQEAREITEDAVKPMVVPLYTRDGKLIVPAPLKGTHEILVHQNTMADREGLDRIKDNEDLDRMRSEKLLVAFPEMAGLEVNEDLPANRRCARPWTVKFAADTAKAYYARFHDSLHLSSAVRTVDYQLRLQRVNGNAASIAGDTASPHLTGQAIDLGKHGMTVAEIAWMRSYLTPLIDAGKVDVEEEFQQACFHISVYQAYAPAAVRKKVVREVASAAGQ